MIRFIDLTNGVEIAIPEHVKFVVALGNFDGVHRAHARLLQQALAMSQKLNAQGECDVRCAVWCFSTPSGDYLANAAGSHLTTLAERLSLFAANGISYAFVADFPSLRNYSPHDFIEEILVQRCHVVGTVCGYNFRFGKMGAGDASLLAERFGASTAIIPKTCLSEQEETVISSTAIRSLLSQGESERAVSFLGYPYFLCSTVLRGKQLGRTLGLPTINQCFAEEKLIPKRGIYATLCILPDGTVYPGVSNIGKRPTVDGDGQINCETHIPGISMDLYGKTVTVCFVRFLREEKRFASLEELQQAIRTDVLSMQDVFSATLPQTLSNGMNIVTKISKRTEIQ